MCLCVFLIILGNKYAIFFFLSLMTLPFGEGRGGAWGLYF
jgi:hypothetical protein